MSRRMLLVAGCLVLLLGGMAWLRALAYAPAGTDEQQIVAQIQRGQRAAELLSASGLMRIVSPEYKDNNGITRPVLGYQTRDQLREAQSLEVTIPMNRLQIQVDPDRHHATSTVPLELRMTDKHGGTRTLSMTPTADWRKERTRRYLLFPAEEWRVVKVEGMGSLAE
jgi:hypothetical protein